MNMTPNERQSLSDELRRRAGWNTDLHTYSFDLTIEQADYLIAALAATQEPPAHFDGEQALAEFERGGGK